MKIVYLYANLKCPYYLKRVGYLLSPLLRDVLFLNNALRVLSTFYEKIVCTIFHFYKKDREKVEHDK